MRSNNMGIELINRFIDKVFELLRKKNLADHVKT